MGTRNGLERLLRGVGVDAVARRGLGLAERFLRGIGGAEIVYLVGLAGHPNYGDELVLRTWLRYLARVRPTATVVVDVAHVGEASLLFAGDHPRAVFVDTLWRLARVAEEQPEVRGELSPHDWVAAAATDLAVAPGLAEGVDHLLRASTVHVVGGGYVNGMWPQWLPVISGVAAVARRTGARAFATGLGLLPLPTGADLARLLSDAGAFEVFDVRDAPSRAALDGVPGATFTGDDVWLGLDQDEPHSADHHGEVALCVQADLSEGFEWHGRTGSAALAAFIGDTLDDWEVPGSQVTVVEGIPGMDFTVPKLLGDRIDGARVVPFLDVWRAGLPVGAGFTWISTRFHPHMVAAAAGDSGVAIVPKPDYYGIKHRSLVDAGSRWTVIDGAASVPARPAAGGFSTADRRSNVARKTALANRLYES